MLKDLDNQGALFDLDVIEGGGCWSISLGDPVCLSVFISESK